MEVFQSWDYELFRLINGSLQGTILEDFLTLIRNKYVWLPLYVGIFAYIFANLNLKKASYYALFIVSAVSLTDIASSRIIKNSVQRLRPCQDPVVKDDIIQRVHCSNSFSFTSSHATNHFGIATLLAFLFGRRRRWLTITAFSWAGMICIAQVFVGVHYPLDILAGAILGISLIKLFTHFYIRWAKQSLDELN